MAKKILIVDDEHDLVETLTFRLQTSGYEVISAFDGSSGLDKARKERPDLILLDVMMPKMDGYQVCRLLKFDETFKNIPIIMLTARGQEQDKKIGKEIGANAYIVKPFEGALLVQKVREMLGE